MVKRLVIYLNEMFPLSNIIGTFLYAFIVYSSLNLMEGQLIQFDIRYLVGATSLLCFILLIRVMDEFKDYPDDLKNYPNRPLPSGRVFRKDLLILGTFCFSLGIILNLFNQVMFIAALFCLGYSLLMLKWFFIEKKMRKSLFLALISHHPIVYFYLFYLAVVYFQVKGEFHFFPLLVLIPIGCTSTNWEISRKIRSPWEETDYVTYSQIWTPRKAIAVALFHQLLTYVGLVFFLVQTQSPQWFIFITLLCIPFLVAPYFIFLKEFKHQKHFKKYAENVTAFLIVNLFCYTILKYFSQT